MQHHHIPACPSPNTSVLTAQGPCRSAASAASEIPCLTPSACCGLNLQHSAGCAPGDSLPVSALGAAAGPSSRETTAVAVPAQGPNGVYCRATLVVCPLVAVIQWRQEIARFTAPGALKVGLLRRVLQPWAVRHATSIDSTSHCSACHTSLPGPAAQQPHPCEPIGAGRSVFHCACWS